MEPEDIQDMIDAKHRMLAREHATRKMWLMIALTGFASVFVPPMAWVALGVGLLLAAFSYSESLRLVREISALAKRREQTIDEQIEEFVQERGDLIRRRMQTMMEREARDQERRRNSPSMFKGNCIDITTEK